MDQISLSNLLKLFTHHLKMSQAMSLACTCIRLNFLFVCLHPKRDLECFMSLLLSVESRIKVKEPLRGALRASGKGYSFELQIAAMPRTAPRCLPVFKRVPVASIRQASGSLIHVLPEKVLPEKGHWLGQCPHLWQHQVL